MKLSFKFGTVIQSLCFLFIIILSQTTHSQTTECISECNKIFEYDLRTTYKLTETQKIKNILYEYFKSNQKRRSEIKNGESNGIGIDLIIGELPIDFGLSSETSSEGNKYYDLYKEIIRNECITDELLQSIYISTLPSEAFTAYNNCLDKCSPNNGVTLINTSKQDNLIVLQLGFISSPAGGSITIDKATYSTGDIIDGQSFTSGRKIIDRQFIYENIRIDPEEDFTVTVSFKEGGVNPAQVSILSKSKRRRSTDAPIGTMVASLLEYEDFLEINGLEKEGDINKTIWVPCDGRTIGTEEGTYGAYALEKGKAPDIRGVFLRGANDMGVSGAPQLDSAQVNPQHTAVGILQFDAFQGHWHSMHSGTSKYGDGGRTSIYGNSAKIFGVGRIRDPISDSKSGNPRISSETRPKNITVYYYVKIR